MVGAGTLFSYLSAFVTIVLALGLSDLLMSFHRLLRNARTIRWAALPLAAALFVLLALFSEFFTMWSLTEVERVSFGGLILHMLPTIFIFLAASAVLPDEIDKEGFDLGAFYLDQKLYFYVTLAFAFVSDIPRWLLGTDPTLLDILHHLVSPTGLAAAIFILLAFVRWRWVHWLGLAIVFGMVLWNFPQMLIEAPAAVEPLAANASS